MYFLEQCHVLKPANSSSFSWSLRLPKARVQRPSDAIRQSVQDSRDRS
jgi:hypothetical protein